MHDRVYKYRFHSFHVDFSATGTYASRMVILSYSLTETNSTFQWFPEVLHPLYPQLWVCGDGWRACGSLGVKLPDRGSEMQCVPEILLIPHTLHSSSQGGKRDRRRASRGEEKGKVRTGEERRDEEWSAACRKKECLPGGSERETEVERKEKSRSQILLRECKPRIAERRQMPVSHLTDLRSSSSHVTPTTGFCKNQLPVKRGELACSGNLNEWWEKKPVGLNNHYLPPSCCQRIIFGFIYWKGQKKSKSRWVHIRSITLLTKKWVVKLLEQIFTMPQMKSLPRATR